MENWGLVTYLQSLFLVDPANHTQSQQLQVSYAIAHEISHQWFGNLVSPKWWSSFWLNEGFAYVFSIIVTDAVCLV